MISEELKEQVRRHAEQCYPSESCGLIADVDGTLMYAPCKNIADDTANDFVLDPTDYALAEDVGEVVGLAHSHPDALPIPSQADLVMCEASGIAWHIVHVAIPDGQTEPVADDINSIVPSGYEAPLIGRTFSHGTLDCYTLVRDFYMRELDIELPDYDRSENWWHRGDDLYMANYEAAGFAPITGAIEYGDIVLMQIRAPVINHAGVYIGNGQIMHHLLDRLSSRELYDGYFQQVTRMVIRRNHEDA